MLELTEEHMKSKMAISIYIKKIREINLLQFFNG